MDLLKGCRGTLFLALLGYVMTTRAAARVYDCPVEWVMYKQHCYKFVHFPSLTYTAASEACQLHGASLVSINDHAEHNFINNWLKKHDLNREIWYTSGKSNFNNEDLFHWEGDGSQVMEQVQFWITPTEKKKTGSHIVYRYFTNSYGWSKTTPDTSLRYICETSQAEAYRILQQHRGFDYGVNVKDPNNIKKGAKIVIEPESVIVVGKTKSAYIECVAFGHPQPKYRWYRENSTQIKTTLDPRYTLTNGRFTFANPIESKDAGTYQCVVSNQFGTVLSTPVQVSFGFLGEFSNVQPDNVVAQAYDGAMVICNKLQYRPAIKYQWVKGDMKRFLRPEKQGYIFISMNGRLYFSEATRDDESTYRCIVTLTSSSSNTIGTSQPPSRITPKLDWGPVIQNDFISVYPQPPLTGQNLKLECFAYGSSPLVYSWHREDKPLPSKVTFSDHNRIMSISSAETEDEGTYVCVVRRGQSAQDTKSYTLVLGGKPFFIFHLTDQHIDIRSQLTWRCEVRANPSAQYTWYKNGLVLKPIPGEIDITENVMVIKQVSVERDSGMYQCGATNRYGTAFSTAQLRVLAIKPTFDKHPVGPFVHATNGGNVTILCQPEAAPVPEIKWLKNSKELHLTRDDKTSRLHRLENKNLHITDLNHGDEGRYTCTATNSEGSSSSSGYLKIHEGTRITQKPSNTVVTVNETAFLFCTASYNKFFDMVYIWTFNGRTIDVDYDLHYKKVSEKDNTGGLIIRRAMFKHAGYYECIAKTTLDQARAGAFLTVRGPPGEAGGVYVEQNSITEHSVQLRWTAGVDRGMPVIKYIVEAKTNFDPVWRQVAIDISDSSTIVDREEKRSILIDGLYPSTSYTFRVRCINIYGVGDPSLPSGSYHTPSSAPLQAPENVGGGGGSVGNLVLNWKPLEPGERCGPGIGYIVYWRRMLGINRKWSKKILRRNVGEFITTVGSENYYLEYEVKVQAFNDLGTGPNSTIEVVYSAEDLPLGTPTSVYSEGYNGTALEVFWEPVADTREVVKGKVLGYQVNYWIDGDDDPPLKQFIRFRGQESSGMCIGLQSDSNYWTDVQVYNSAGLGPKSETFYQEVGFSGSGDSENQYEVYYSRLSVSAPLNYPTEVKVHSLSRNSIRVTWRGISTIQVGEETLEGYKLLVYQATDDIRNAAVTEVGKVDETVIEGLDKNALYKLRILGFSGGGDGKKSETVYFTLGGAVHYDPTKSEILAIGNQLQTSLSTVMCLLTLLKMFFY